MKFFEHDYEPVPGLPAKLPAGETILWQGAPDWKTLARHAMWVRMFAAYFVLLILWGISGHIADGSSAWDTAVSALKLAGLGTVAISLLAGFAWLVARTTLYTITSRRVVMRFGVALPMTLQIAFPMIDAASVQVWGNNAGDIALTTRKEQRVAYFMVWPHARPWKLTKAQPALRGIPDVQAVAQILSRALAMSAAQPARTVAVQQAAVSDRGPHVAAAA
jgi:hypothetical protein